jgi:hypothetical protein
VAKESSVDSKSHKRSNYKVIISNSALDGCAKTASITCHEQTDEKTFLERAKYKVWNLLEHYRNTKIKMKLCCIMMKTDMNTGKDELATSPFWSETMENCTATNVQDIQI